LLEPISSQEPIKLIPSWLRSGWLHGGDVEVVDGRVLLALGRFAQQEQLIDDLLQREKEETSDFCTENGSSQGQDLASTSLLVAQQLLLRNYLLRKAVKTDYEA